MAGFLTTKNFWTWINGSGKNNQGAIKLLKYLLANSWVAQFLKLGARSPDQHQDHDYGYRLLSYSPVRDIL